MIGAMKQWLESLEPIALYKAYNGDDWPARQVAPVIIALRTAIESVERQEPVASVKVWKYKSWTHIDIPEYYDMLPEGTHKLYTYPPAITDEMVEQAAIALHKKSASVTIPFADLTENVKEMLRHNARAALEAAWGVK